MGTKSLFKLKAPDRGEAFKVEDTDGTATIYIDGTQVTSTAAELNILDGVTATAAELNILDGVTSTAAEITRATDLSTRVVALTATDSITEAEHEGRDLYVTGTAAATYTLPEATGSGARYRFIIGEVNTNGTVIVVADTTNANFIGSVNSLDLDAAAQGAFGSPANSDTITLNGTTTGGALGDFIELVDVATDVWMVFGQLQVPTGSNPATPFSAAV